jgi:hypothetical protein
MIYSLIHTLMIKYLCRILASFIAISLPLSAQFSNGESTTPVKGLHTNTPRVHALIHGTLVTRPGETIEDATIIIRDGRIEYSGTKSEVPADARVWDMTGRTIYAGFIDAYSQYGMPEGLKTFQPGGAEEGPPRKMPPTPDSPGPSSWNPLVTPERDAKNYFKPNKKEADKLTDAGFTATATYPARGIFRGQGLLVHTHGNTISEAALKQSWPSSSPLLGGRNPGPASPATVIPTLRQPWEASP